MTKLRPRGYLNLEPKLDAFTYQQEAFRAIRDLPYAAIFHEQGLGKTKIAIDVLLYWLEKKVVDTVLIVAKKMLITNWKRELRLHTHILPQILTQSRKANYYVFNSPARVVLGHFEIFNSEKERFELYLKSRDVGVIVDESAKIKNPSAKLTQSMLHLATLFTRRIILTGTPVANRPEDIWSQIFFLDQGEALGADYPSFKRGVSLHNRLNEDESRQQEFENHVGGIFQRISGFSVRETKDGSRIELPEKIYEERVAEWEPLQYDLYEEYRTELRGIVIRNGVPVEDEADNILKRMLRLIQISSNPALVNEEYPNTPGKLPILLDLVIQIRDKREKCIVWSTFNDNVDWLTKRLKSFGARRLHGRMPIEQRNRSIDKFMTDDSVGVLVATPGVAKEGLTLTVANHVIFYDRSFSLDDYLQAQDRIHRISQARTCFIYNLTMENSIDQWVDKMLSAKFTAAKLAQGDIDIETYRGQMDYSFGDILRGILNIPKNNE